ncbi:MAG: hypothetical protein QXD51_01600, partial [Candidatus Anstonellales archaeon]
MAGSRLWSGEKVNDEIAKTEEKEQKTQAKILQKDLFPTLSSQLNLDQFVKDKEKGTIDIEGLEVHLKEKGFSEDAVNNVEECLNTKAGDTGFIKATADMISAEFYRITLQDNFFDKN